MIILIYSLLFYFEISLKLFFNISPCMYLYIRNLFCNFYFYNIFKFKKYKILFLIYILK